MAHGIIRGFGERGISCAAVQAKLRCDAAHRFDAESDVLVERDPELFGELSTQLASLSGSTGPNRARRGKNLRTSKRVRFWAWT